MNWWRRNWVDALMIALIVGVVGGFAALLLRGSPLNVTNQGTPPASPALENPQPAPAPPPVTPPAAVTPAATPEPAPASPPAITPLPPAPQPAPVVTNKPPPSPTATKPPAASPQPTPSTPKPSAGTTAQKPISSPTAKPASSTKPAASGNAGTKPAQGSGMDANAPGQGVMAAKPIKPPTPTASRPVNPPNPPAAVTVQSAPSRSQFLSNYRVAVGSFSTQSRANTVAARIRAQGLPAAAVPSGKVVVVVVGPYSTESAAQSALRRLGGTYPDAILYRPNGTRSRPSTASPAPRPATVTPSPSTKPNSSSPDSSSVSNNGAYLQVGAFNSTASATPILTQLRRAGYPAQLRSSPDGLTRVLVGPLSSDTLRRARNDLRRRGFSPFTVTK